MKSSLFLILFALAMNAYGANSCLEIFNQENLPEKSRAELETDFKKTLENSFRHSRLKTFEFLLARNTPPSLLTETGPVAGFDSISAFIITDLYRLFWRTLYTKTLNNTDSMEIEKFDPRKMYLLSSPMRMSEEMPVLYWNILNDYFLENHPYTTAEIAAIYDLPEITIQQIVSNPFRFEGNELLELLILEANKEIQLLKKLRSTTH